MQSQHDHTSLKLRIASKDSGISTRKPAQIWEKLFQFKRSFLGHDENYEIENKKSQKFGKNIFRILGKTYC